MWHFFALCDGSNIAKGACGVERIESGRSGAATRRVAQVDNEASGACQWAGMDGKMQGGSCAKADEKDEIAADTAGVAVGKIEIVMR